MAANTLLTLTDLPQPLSKREETAQSARRLEGAHQSVQGLFRTLHAARKVKTQAGKAVRKLEHGEVDLLRAAIVFAGAGIDAVLKQLVRDALPELLNTHSLARGKLQRFGATVVKDQPKTAIAILTSANTNVSLRERYVESLTKGSLQGTSELQSVRDALGISAEGTFDNDALKKLDDFFLARNQIVHELDLKSSSGRGDSTRRARHMKTVRDEADSVFRLSAAFIAKTDELL